MIRILIADDHTILRDGLKQILRDCSDMVVAGEAENGSDVLNMIRAQDWDVLVLDMSMPGRSGLELIKLIKQEKPRLPILILSMHKEDQYAVRTLRAGASGYLCKDSASSQLVQAIRTVASGNLFITSAVAENLARGVAGKQPEQEQPHTTLSDRELQIFQMLASGKGISEIADELFISVKTVSTHKTRLMQKMNLANSSELVQYAIRHDLLG